MSPLEAAGLTMLLITQKLSNEDFQVTPKVWAQMRHQEQVAIWEAHRSGAAAPVRISRRARALRESEKANELLQTLTNRAGDIGLLVDGLLTEMGVSNEGGMK